jgi:hypothetical protein
VRARPAGKAALLRATIAAGGENAHAYRCHHERRYASPACPGGAPTREGGVGRGGLSEVELTQRFGFSLLYGDGSRGGSEALPNSFHDERRTLRAARAVVATRRSPPRRWFHGRVGGQARALFRCVRS